MWPYSAGCGLTCRLAVSAMAGWSLAWPRVCGRWLPVRLPGKPLAALMFESPGARPGRAGTCRRRGRDRRACSSAPAWPVRGPGGTGPWPTPPYHSPSRTWLPGPGPRRLPARASLLDRGGHPVPHDAQCRGYGGKCHEKQRTDQRFGDGVRPPAACLILRGYPWAGSLAGLLTADPTSAAREPAITGRRSDPGGARRAVRCPTAIIPPQLPFTSLD